MGAYDNPKIQSLDYSFIEKGVAGLTAVLAEKKKQKAELREKIKIRETGIIEQETALGVKINQLPKILATTFDKNMEDAMEVELGKVHVLGQNYAKSGSTDDYKLYTEARKNLEASLPKLKITVDNMNKEMTNGYDMINSGKIDGQNGSFSYRTPLYGLQMAHNWGAESGSKITPKYESGEWNFRFNDGNKHEILDKDGKGTGEFVEGVDLNSKEWISSVEKGGDGVIIAVENDYINTDKSIFKNIAGSNYKAYNEATESGDKKELKVKWDKANRELNKEFEAGDFDDIFIKSKGVNGAGVLDNNRWEAQGNYSKFGPYEPGSNIQVIEDADGNIIGYFDIYDEVGFDGKEVTGGKERVEKDKYYAGVWKDKDGNVIDKPEDEKIKLRKQQDYFKEQTWDLWQQYYAGKSRTTSVAPASGSDEIDPYLTGGDGDDNF
jgi:hypothetical protein